MTSQLLAIEDRSQIAGARRSVTQLAESLGFDVDGVGRATLAVTECATNMLKYAGHGRLLLRRIVSGPRQGLEILALDRGGGIADVTASLRDGHSTAGSPGTGLGALARLSAHFDIYSRAQAGTALRLELWADAAATPTASTEVGGVCVPMRGELVAGDNWAVQYGAQALTLMVADGLGHGASAETASAAAVAVLNSHADKEPAEIMAACHRALTVTRGAAVAIAHLEPAQERGRYVGVGNIAARLYDGLARRHLVSHNGTIGHNARKIEEFAFPFPKSALLILHSDGLDTHWDFAAYPGLGARHPGLIAGVLYRDHERGRDDATVVVVRNASDGHTPT